MSNCIKEFLNIKTSYYGLTVASPYVGMARKQDGGSNQGISVYMVLSLLGKNAHG